MLTWNEAGRRRLAAPCRSDEIATRLSPEHSGQVNQTNDATAKASNKGLRRFNRHAATGWQPRYPSRLTRVWAGGFASPSLDGFALKIALTLRPLRSPFPRSCNGLVQEPVMLRHV